MEGNIKKANKHNLLNALLTALQDLPDKRTYNA